FAYDDLCIAQIAKAIGNAPVYERFIQRAQNWKNLFDPVTGFMRPRRNCGFPQPFDPFQVDFNYTEANAWQYSLFVPHDLGTLREYLGGRDSLTSWLDRLFRANSITTGREQADITGLIGQYAHGNEPSHGFAYYYQAGSPVSHNKSFDIVERIQRDLYGLTPDGLCGNEDCGQMSAWLVCSMLGDYPLVPGTPASFDGLTIDQRTEQAWTIRDHIVTPLPVIQGPALPFADSATIEIYCADQRARILISVKEEGKPYYKHYYRGPFTISNAAVVTAKASAEGCIESREVYAVYKKRDASKLITYVTPFSAQYTAGGDQALVDGQRGSADFRTGSWQGWQTQHTEVVVDLGKEQPITYVGLGCLQDIKSWIWYPTHIEIWVSHDGQTFSRAAGVKNEKADNDYTPGVQELGAHLRASARYVKVVAYNYGTIPPWHLGSGGNSWIFADELII
ncbi:MAG: glycoside hydrolase family 92 protein, partial [Flavobacteriales bacterium]|nr:glycoside hydrolase family 92 protein [Flavobacteriales bacterium]